MNTINIKEILLKHMDAQELVGGHGLRVEAAIREACEATVDMCLKAYNDSNFVFDGENPIYTPTTTRIRNVKNQIV